MSDTIDKHERRKDTVQVVVDSGATHIGNIVGIVVGAVRDVTGEIGEWATDMFEIRDASRRAEADAERTTGDPPAGAVSERPRADRSGPGRPPTAR